MPLAGEREQELKLIDHAVPRTRATSQIRHCARPFVMPAGQMMDKLANSQHIDSVTLSTYVRLGLAGRRCLRPLDFGRCNDRARSAADFTARRPRAGRTPPAENAERGPGRSAGARRRARAAWRPRAAGGPPV